MQFVPPRQANNVRLNMGNVPAEIINSLPPTLMISAVVCGRIKGQGISLKGIEMQYLMTTPDEIIVFGKGGSIAWRQPLVGVKAEKQAIDAVRVIAANGDDIRFITGTPKRGEIIAHIDRAVKHHASPVAGGALVPTEPMHSSPQIVSGAVASTRPTSRSAVSFPVHIAMSRGIDLTEGHQVTMLIDHTHVRLFDGANSQLVLEIPNSDLVEFVAGGPGEVSSGGGFFGGGFGIQGAITGMAIASALNALTTRSSIQTTVRLSTAAFTIALFSNQNTPEEIQLVAPAIVPKTSTALPSLADEIAKLSELHANGILSDEEFANAKSRLITGS